MKTKRYAYFKAGDAAEELNLVGPSPDTFQDGGPTKYVAAFLHLVRGHEVQLHSLDLARKRLQRSPVTAQTYPYTSLHGPIGKLHKAWVMLTVFVALLRFRPHVILCPLMGSPLWTSGLAAWLTGGKLVHSRHSIVPAGKGLWGSISRRLDRRAIRFAIAVLCHGTFLADQLKAEGIRADKVLPFVPDIREFRTMALASKQRALPPDSRYILYSGRITENKGAIDLLQACIPLLAKFPDLSLVYAGRGPALPTLKQLAEAAGIASQVILLGFVDYERLGTVFRDALFVVTPTQSHLTEGRCMTVAEAQVLGRPVVAPDFGPFSHYLRHGQDALLYEPDNLDQLHDNIQALIADPEMLERLSSGAAASGKIVLKPIASFLSVLHEAFRRAGAAPSEFSQRKRKDTSHE